MNFRVPRSALILCSQVLLMGQVFAQEPLFQRFGSEVGRRDALSVGGASGGMLIPDGRAIGDGVVAFGFNNFVEPRFAEADRGDNYLFALGLLPYLEISGRLANYPSANAPNIYGFYARDLSANLKLEMPRLFQWQPDVAFGMNDLGGGASLLQSKYLVVSQSFGELRLSAGRAQGDSYLNGWFGGAELALGRTGVALLAERIGQTSTLGARYRSVPLPWLANGRVSLAVHHSFPVAAANGRRYYQTNVAVNLAMPFGENARSQVPARPVSDAVWTTPPEYRNYAPVAVVNGQATGLIRPQPVSQKEAAANAVTQLQGLQNALEKAGLERVRLGLNGARLVIEYENHRYNQNEADAIGIALGLGARLAPEAVAVVSVISRKAGLVMYETRVERLRFQRYLEDGDLHEVRVGFDVIMRPETDSAVQWLEQAGGKRGYSRVSVEPLVRSFVGTEYGVFDYSAAAKVDAFVPLWKGAELTTSYLAHVADSENVRPGGIFNYAKVPSGVNSATLTQSFWITNQLLNVTSVGKFLYDFTGVQNQTLWLAPALNSQLRLEYTNVESSARGFKETKKTAGLFYSWNYVPLNVLVEPGYSRYVAKDHGPSLRLSRWFGDVQAQAYLRRSSGTTFLGFRLAFPLAARRGMAPGISHLEGASQFSYGLETKLATQGDCNCIVAGVGESIPLVYNARNVLLNQGRVGKSYLSSQLPRMREAALLFASFE